MNPNLPSPFTPPVSAISEGFTSATKHGKVHYMKTLFPLILVPCLLVQMGTAAEAPQIQALSVTSALSGAESGARQAVLQQPVEFVFPQLIIGGEWTTVIKLTNRSTKAIPQTNVYFLDNLGNPLKTTFQTTGGNVINDTGFSFGLQPGGVIEGTFFGGSSTQFGHAYIALCNNQGTCLTGVYGEVTLRNRNSTRPDFESVFPLEQPAPLQYMLWDHRNGVTTTLYLVNEDLSTTIVGLDFVDTSNRLIRTVNITMPNGSAQILTLHALVPETIGIQGTLVIRGQNSNGANVTATALRINPSNSFTPMRAFIPRP